MTRDVNDTIQKLIGKSVFSITFGMYIFHISFDDRDVISISAPFCFFNETSSEEKIVEEFPLSRTDLVKVIGKRVIAARTDDDDISIISFDGGNELVIYKGYPESFSIKLQDEEYTY